MLRFEHIHVLADIMTPAVEVVDDVLGAEDRHPLLDIRQGLGLRRVKRDAGGVQSVSDDENICIIVGGLEGTLEPIPPIFLGLLFVAAIDQIARGENLQLRLGVGNQAAPIAKLEGAIDLVEFPVGIAGRPLFQEVAARLLR